MTPKMRESALALAAMLMVIAGGFAVSAYLRQVFAGPAPSAYVAGAATARTLVPAGALSFDGESFRCASFPAVFSPDFNDYGAAFFGFIVLNRQRFELLPLPVKRFAYAHECGHQYVGYSETDADCYAVKRGIKAGWLDDASLEEVCAFFSKSKGSPFHLPGPKRCALIRACYSSSRAR